MIFLFFIVLFLYGARSVHGLHGLHASTVAWRKVSDVAKAHASDPNYAEAELTEAELISIFNSVWNDLKSLCPTIPLEHNVDVGFDERLLDPDEPDWSGTLGYAYASEVLSGGVWSSVLTSQSTYDLGVQLGVETTGVMRVARGKWLPGGWFRGEGACSYKFRLEDVLKHEILHLLGVSASIRENNDGELYVGSDYLGLCFPGRFDRVITNKAGEQVVSTSCELNAQIGAENIFVNGVTLYQATEYLPGTSISHLRSLDSMMTPSIGYCYPDGVKPLTTLDGDVLNAIGIVCDAAQLVQAEDGRFTNPGFLPYELDVPDEPDPIVDEPAPVVNAPTYSPSPQYSPSLDTAPSDDLDPPSVDPIQQSSQGFSYHAPVGLAEWSQWGWRALLVAAVSASLAFRL